MVVFNLTVNVTEADIKSYFEIFGRVLSVQKAKRNSPDKRFIAFVVFEEDVGINSAVAAGEHQVGFQQLLYCSN